MARILIVDDSSFARKMHRSILERAGHVVEEESTGNGAIERFSLERPDVVLLDLSMEDLGGVQVLDMLRQVDPYARVIVLSADVQRSTEQAVREGGAARFLSKPANPELLARAVAEVLEGPAA